MTDVKTKPSLYMCFPGKLSILLDLMGCPTGLDQPELQYSETSNMLSEHCKLEQSVVG